MNTFGDRVRSRRKELGLSQKDLADPSGLSQTTISDIERGRNDGSREIIALAKVLRVQAQWLAYGLPPKDIDDTGERTSTQTAKWVDSVGEPIAEWNDEADLNPEEFTIIPRFDITVSAGNGHIVTEERQKNKGQAYRVDWLKAMGLKGHDLKSISAKGDSMLPTFGDGCTLLVDFSHKQISEGKVYVIRFGDEIRVKRIYKRLDGGIIIRSDNRDAYPDINVPPEEMKNIEILGRVRHYSGDL